MKEHGVSRWTTSLRLLPLLVAMLLPLQMWGEDIKNLLTQLPGISNVTTLKSTTYDHKYLMEIRQWVDPNDTTIGAFQQRVIVCHVGFDRPTVLVTEGYTCNYALKEGYAEELSKLFNANLVFVEYRYFASSTPQPCDWRYLTVENSLADLHHVNTTFRRLYTGKWMATGISKGGQTCLFYRVFYPNDVDISVPYVAPLNRKVEDGRHEPFLREQVGTAKERERVLNFQKTVLQRRSSLMPLFKDYVSKNRLTFRAPLDEIYDLCVLEYAFAFWQWGTPASTIPSSTASDATLFNHLMRISNPGYFSIESSDLSFNVQAAKQLGYYGYDVKPLRKWLSVKTTKDYLRRIMLPDSLRHEPFDATLYHKTMTFLRHNDPKMIFIYGGLDPWGSSGVAKLDFLANKRNIRVFVLPRGSHATRIASFPKIERDEIVDIIKEWLAE